MRILIFHGYLLGGTGSNVYNARPGGGARARRATRCTCCARTASPFEQDWVDAAGDWDGGALAVETRSRARARDGLPPRPRRPAAGLRRRPLRRHRGPAVPRADRRRARRATSSATSPPCARSPSARAPDVALANHLVMGPVVARARRWRGSTSPTRSRSTARRSSTRSSRIPSASSRTPARGSRAPAAYWSARATPPRACGRRWTTPGSRRRTRLGPPGVDIERVRPARAGRGAGAASRRSAERVRAARAGDGRLLLRARHRRRRRRRWPASTPSATASSSSSAS